MGLFAKTSGEGWSFDKRTGQLTLSGELDFLVSEDFEALGKRVRSVVALKGARTTRGFDLFAHLKNLETADLRELDVSECDSLHMMFLGCSSLVSLDLSTWDVGKVESMWYMFAGCSSLVSLDLSSWDVRKVKEMGSMFENCAKLERIKTGPLWIPRLVEKAFGMFSGCLALQKLDLSAWHFGSLHDCGQMFCQCWSLEQLDLSSMLASYVEEMPDMFAGCRSLRTLKLGGWNLGKVKDLHCLFEDCGKLEILDLTGWHVPSDANTEDMFKGVPGSVQVTASDDSVTRLLPQGATVVPCGWRLHDDGSLVIDGPVGDWLHMTGDGGMIEEISSAPWYNLRYKIRRVIAMPGAWVPTCLNMFANCSGLEVADLRCLQMAAGADLSGMFRGCSALEKIDVGNMDVSSVRRMDGVFQGCSELEEIDLSRWDVSGARSLERFFDGCEFLAKCNLDGWRTGEGASVKDFFGGCESLELLRCSDAAIRKEAQALGNAQESPTEPDVITRTPEKLEYQDLFGGMSRKEAKRMKEDVERTQWLAKMMLGK